jgi:FtsZ-interacting cell division protein ZipA
MKSKPAPRAQRCDEQLPALDQMMMESVCPATATHKLWNEPHDVLLLYLCGTHAQPFQGTKHLEAIA